MNDEVQGSAVVQFYWVNRGNDLTTCNDRRDMFILYSK